MDRVDFILLNVTLIYEHQQSTFKVSFHARCSIHKFNSCYYFIVLKKRKRASMVVTYNANIQTSLGALWCIAEQKQAYFSSVSRDFNTPTIIQTMDGVRYVPFPKLRFFRQKYNENRRVKFNQLAKWQCGKH
jgi:hypothetical protein